MGGRLGVVAYFKTRPRSHPTPYERVFPNSLLLWPVSSICTVKNPSTSNLGVRDALQPKRPFILGSGVPHDQWARCRPA